MLIKNIPMAALALCVLSCNLESGGDSAKPTPTPAPTPQRAVEAPKARPPALSPVDRETISELRSPEVLAREEGLRQRFATALGRAPSSNLAFIDCEEGPCLARFSAASDEALQLLLQGLSQDFEGQVEFIARERLDPYQGRSFEADVTVDP